MEHLQKEGVISSELYFRIVAKFLLHNQSLDLLLTKTCLCFWLYISYLLSCLSLYLKRNTIKSFISLLSKQSKFSKISTCLLNYNFKIEDLNIAGKYSISKNPQPFIFIFEIGYYLPLYLLPVQKKTTQLSCLLFESTTVYVFFSGF